MLELSDIRKNYDTGAASVEALKGINLRFRDCEFVSILGQSGCGKTTMLNIIGGLDQYTSGDLKINGKSTKNFKDRDWDAYRNNSIGFVFQSYNLIPHQSVLSNVELALTLSGVSKSERRKRAVEALEKVGLGEHIHKKPNQMSGGQMQRVAIARALVNNPDILLADEPTGALDTDTSVQIMEILKEISKDRLIIMVTHNPELAMKYSTRIIRLLDGNITDDSNPYTKEQMEEDILNIDTSELKLSEKDKKESRQKKSKTSMSFLTALSLSTNNLMTKKARTLLTAFAGSIGIIGIALILAISNGIQDYINRVQRETLSSYPVQLQAESVDVGSLVQNMSSNKEQESEHDEDRIYSNNIMTEMVNTMTSTVKRNNLEAFRKYIEKDDDRIKNLASDIQYSYSLPLYIYDTDTKDKVTRLNPSTVMENMYGMSVSEGGMMSAGMQNTSVWTQLLNNQDLLDEQYDMVAGNWPQNYNEVVIVVDNDNEIDDYTLYSLGFKNPDEVKKIFQSAMSGDSYETEETSYSYDEVLNKTFKVVLPGDLYRYNEKIKIWEDMTKNEEYMKAVVDESEEIKISGIIRPKEDAVNTSIASGIGYTSALMEHLIEENNGTQIVKEQLADKDTDVFSGLSFEDAKTLTYESNSAILGITDADNPSGILIYAKNFEEKEQIEDIIKEYNDKAKQEEREADVINYTDYVGIMMSSVSTIITAISSVLIAFVAISLAVSSIMISIITYISVLERTKEIGILRSIGASKKDISRVFNAETLIEGFASGVLGIIITLILCIPANIIIENVTDIANVAKLPWVGAVILIIISMCLTMLAGFIPAKMAAKKDPVVALRTE
ncbi:MAG: ATP-binding cassette domain-containing protein [Lachnospira sp.]